MEKEAAKASKGCLMLAMPEAAAKLIRDWKKEHVPDDQIVEDEDWPHLTLLYGFGPEVEASDVLPHLPARPLEVSLGKIKRFAADDKRPDSDVLVIEASGWSIKEKDELALINTDLKKEFDVTSTYKGYNPHVTIAYIKPGVLKELDGGKPFDHESYPCVEVVYSSGPEGKRERTSHFLDTPKTEKAAFASREAARAWEIELMKLLGQTPGQPSGKQASPILSHLMRAGSGGARFLARVPQGKRYFSSPMSGGWNILKTLFNPNFGRWGNRMKLPVLGLSAGTATADGYSWVVDEAKKKYEDIQANSGLIPEEHRAPAMDVAKRFRDHPISTTLKSFVDRDYSKEFPQLPDPVRQRLAGASRDTIRMGVREGIRHIGDYHQEPLSILNALRIPGAKPALKMLDKFIPEVEPEVAPPTSKLQTGYESLLAKQSSPLLISLGIGRDGVPELSDPPVMLKLAYKQSGVKAHLSLVCKSVNTEPTEAQKVVGNYAKGHWSHKGLNFSIENPKGSKRKGKDKDGTPWEITMTATYGYVKGTKGRDGDQLDVFFGPKHSSDKVFVVDQMVGGKFDEHKCVLFTSSEDEARELYLSNYPKDWKCGPITDMTWSEFKEWAMSDKIKKPAAAHARARMRHFAVHEFSKAAFSPPILNYTSVALPMLGFAAGHAAGGMEGAIGGGLGGTAASAMLAYALVKREENKRKSRKVAAVTPKMFASRGSDGRITWQDNPEYQSPTAMQSAVPQDMSWSGLGGVKGIGGGMAATAKKVPGFAGGVSHGMGNISGQVGSYFTPGVGSANIINDVAGFASKGVNDLVNNGGYYKDMLMDGKSNQQRKTMDYSHLEKNPWEIDTSKTMPKWVPSFAQPAVKNLLGTVQGFSNATTGAASRAASGIAPMINKDLRDAMTFDPTQNMYDPATGKRTGYAYKSSAFHGDDGFVKVRDANGNYVKPTDGGVKGMLRHGASSVAGMLGDSLDWAYYDAPRYGRLAGMALGNGLASVAGFPKAMIEGSVNGSLPDLKHKSPFDFFGQFKEDQESNLRHAQDVGNLWSDPFNTPGMAESFVTSASRPLNAILDWKDSLASKFR